MEVTVGKVGARLVARVEKGHTVDYIHIMACVSNGDRRMVWVRQEGGLVVGVRWIDRVVVSRDPGLEVWMVNRPIIPLDHVEVGRMGRWRWTTASPETFTIWRKVWLFWGRVAVLEVDLDKAGLLEGVDRGKLGVVEMMARMGKEMDCER